MQNVFENLYSRRKELSDSIRKNWIAFNFATTMSFPFDWNQIIDALVGTIGEWSVDPFPHKSGLSYLRILHFKNQSDKEIFTLNFNFELSNYGRNELCYCFMVP